MPAQIDLGGKYLDANTKAGMYEVVQHGVQFPDGHTTWGTAGEEQIRTPYGDIYPVEPRSGFWDRMPHTTLEYVSERYRKALHEKHVPLTDDMVLTHVSRRITVIVGETEAHAS